MSGHYLIAGDIGGTHSLLRLVQAQADVLELRHEIEYPSAGYKDFGDLLADFFAEQKVSDAIGRIAAACFAVAGPVEGRTARLTNLDWHLDCAQLGARFGISQVLLVNDFAAVGHGIAALGKDDLVTLQPGVAQSHRPRLVVGAGTGLGVCVLTPEGGGYAVHASEGGHADFAPVNATQDALLVSLRAVFGRVSYERVLSGPGLPRIFSFMRNSGGELPSKQLLETIQRKDEAAAISEFALGKLDPLAVRTLDLFVEVYGAFTGNLALTMLASGGVYIAGGVARQIVSKMEDGSFVRAFGGKGRFANLLSSYPIHLVTDRTVGLKGALQLASRAAVKPPVD